MSLPSLDAEAQGLLDRLLSILQEDQRLASVIYENGYSSGTLTS